ncbi:MAG TPA: FAD-dependent oxidoreductase [Stackebrandtia sp.]|jgi:NADH dehydrogenase FAD-containing subunit|uniref:NAD(P)/FAD-dependent oxidoreductase n=1 Tax=Stackebrandtia sp. TaxID=2023065 RepID=UPI002D233B44|nr:FAD-dependent oxidoreductase [Stackebrandtia sp.]HZE39485.1 FAD-dependent oxidoreductase [Stackebrandtia sp.]
MTVAIIGGGYGGITAAKQLDEVTDVVLIDPRDAFAHNVGALRGVVDPRWSEQIFFPFDKLLTRGRFARARATHVDAASVTLDSGERIAADYIVLATGLSYPFPAKIDHTPAEEAQSRYRDTHRELTGADRVLVLGAGAVGLELAGEISEVWPDKKITIVDPADDILSGLFADEFRTELRRQLAERGIDLVLGTRLTDEPPAPAGTASTFDATTTDGRALTADIWFRCYGGAPDTAYLSDELAAARGDNGRIAVTEHLTIDGFDNVFAIGDLAATPGRDTAKAAGDHGRIAASNIQARLNGGELTRLEAPNGDGIVLPLGPKGGASYIDGMGMQDAAWTSEMKGADLMVGRFGAMFE